MSVRIQQAPASEPITLAEAKAHLRVDHEDDDALITALITVARQYAEDYLDSYLITQTVDLFFDAFPCGGLFVLPAPLQSISYVKYYDSDNTQQTVDVADYEVDAVSRPARLRPVQGKSWEPTRQRLNAVEIRGVFGYGLAAAVPAPIIQAMKLLIGAWYENREAVSQFTNIQALPKVIAADALLYPHRVWR